MESSLPVPFLELQQGLPPGLELSILPTGNGELTIQAKGSGASMLIFSAKDKLCSMGYLCLQMENTWNSVDPEEARLVMFSPSLYQWPKDRKIEGQTVREACKMVFASTKEARRA